LQFRDDDSELVYRRFGTDNTVNSQVCTASDGAACSSSGSILQENALKSASLLYASLFYWALAGECKDLVSN